MTEICVYDALSSQSARFLDRATCTEKWAKNQDCYCKVTKNPSHISGCIRGYPSLFRIGAIFSQNQQQKKSNGDLFSDRKASSCFSIAMWKDPYVSAILRREHKLLNQKLNLVSTVPNGLVVTSKTKQKNPRPPPPFQNPNRMESKSELSFADRRHRNLGSARHCFSWVCCFLGNEFGFPPFLMGHWLAVAAL